MTLSVPFRSLVFMGLFFGGVVASVEAKKSDTDDQQRAEEREDYYKKWLMEDVIYVITEPEKEVFKKLSTLDEKDRFIEQFWFRRDPDPRTAYNEFKEEHYRRIAYANDVYTSGWPGWKTDRGRVYIILGPPNEIEANPSGGWRTRTPFEGGGESNVYPFEIWRYHYVEGVGSNVELEFVNKTFTGDYRLAWNPNDKEADTNISHTMEFAGVPRGYLERWVDRDNPFVDDREWVYNQLRPRDHHFERYLTVSKVQRPPEIKYKDLQEVVDTHIRFEDLPFQFGLDMIQLNQSSVIVPVTVFLANKDLTFQDQSDGTRKAEITLYGIVKDLGNRIVAEFEDDILAQYRPDRPDLLYTGRSIYQKKVILNRPGRYKLNLVVKDVYSGRVGAISKGIFPPPKMTSSTLILADWVERDSTDDPSRMFVLGNLYVRPRIDRCFEKNIPVWAYIQLYGTGIDQSSGKPALDVQYRILKGDELLWERADPGGSGSLDYFSEQRAVLVQKLEVLDPGQYKLQIEVQDKINNTSNTSEISFKISDSMCSG